MVVVVVPHMPHGFVVALAVVTLTVVTLAVVTLTVVTLTVVALAGVVPRVVSWALLSGCVVLWSGSPCRVRCRCCSHRAMFGVAGTVVVLCLVLWLPLSRCASSCVHYHHAVFVLRFPSLHHAWCHGHCHHAAFGVAVAVVALHVVSWLWWVSCSRVVSQLHSLHGRGGCCCATCCCSCGYCAAWCRGHGRCTMWCR
jgi:hypothetical protein